MASRGGVGTSGDWVRTITGALGAIAIMSAGVWTVVIIPQNQRIEKLETNREGDAKRLVDLYLSVQTNDQYKNTIRAEIDHLRADVARIESKADRMDADQRRRVDADLENMRRAASPVRQ